MNTGTHVQVDYTYASRGTTTTSTLEKAGQITARREAEEQTYA
jgi:hypothetical protein